MKCLIVEDEQPAVKVLLQHIGAFPDVKVESIFNNALDALAMLQRVKIDLMFLDIQLPRMNGIELLQALPQKPLIVMTTAFREFAPEAFELEVTDYLLKPISFQRFARAMGKVYRLNQKEVVIEKTEQLFSEPFIFIKVDREFQRIALNELMIVESIKNHVKLVTRQKTYITLMSISEIELKLPPSFLRVHRSYIVSKQHIEKFTAGYVQIDKHTIPVGSHYKMAFQKWVQNNL